MSMSSGIDVPSALAAAPHYDTEFGRAWIAGLPALVRQCLDRWSLRPDGPTRHGAAALVLPVVRSDDTPAVLKLRPVDEESVGEPVALDIWDGHGTVQLHDHDPDTGALLLERLDATRPLSCLPDEIEAVQILAEILARLVAHPAPEGMRRLADIAAGMLEEVPRALASLHDRADQQLVHACAAAVHDLIDEPGDRLLHWDLHYDNILTGHREPWLAIDPCPLAGDPGFDLLPALGNRWDDIAAAGDTSRAVLRRFDRLTDVLSLDRQRASGWTLGRILQNALWDIEDGKTALAPAQIAIAEALIRRDSGTSHRRTQPKSPCSSGNRSANNTALETATQHSTGSKVVDREPR